MTQSAGQLPISRLLAVQSLHAGIDAARAGRPMTACPYSATSSVETGFARHLWVKGWRGAIEAQQDTDPAG